MLKQLTTAIAALALCACASTGGSRVAASDPVIDATSQLAFGESLKAMYGELDDKERVKLSLSIYLIGLQQLKEQGKLTPDGKPAVELTAYDVRERIAGMDYDEILALAGT
jgi:hypothetical protein